MSDLQSPTEYDVIVVGGGTAGCILASRISEDSDVKVLLLEAGIGFTGRDDCPPELLDEATYPFELMWSYEGVPTERDDHTVIALRGKALGGSGAVNGGLFGRGMPEDYDSWGSPEWTNEALLPYFAKVENDLDNPGDGTGMVAFRRGAREEWPPSQRAFFDAGLAAGYAEVADHLSNLEDGIGASPRNAVDGVRMNAALAYLAKASDRENLTVLSDTAVTRVLFEGRDAVGVEAVRDGESVEYRGGETIIAAGAIGSPQILLLSGVGPREQLDELGVPVVVERPGVGRNYTDHAAIQAIARLKKGVEEGDARNHVWLRATTEGSSVEGDLFVVVSSGDFSQSLESNFSISGDSIPDESQNEAGVDVCIFSLLNYPESKGTIELDPANPAGLPRVHYNYLDSPADLARFREANRIACELLETGPFAAIVESKLAPTTEDCASDENLDAYITNTVGTAFHGSGSCKMGDDADADAVVGWDGAVIGATSLRVADLSIAPRVVRGPTNLTAMVIAERIAAIVDQRG